MPDMAEKLTVPRYILPWSKARTGCWNDPYSLEKLRLGPTDEIVKFLVAEPAEVRGTAIKELTTHGEFRRARIISLKLAEIDPKAKQHIEFIVEKPDSTFLFNESTGLAPQRLELPYYRLYPRYEDFAQHFKGISFTFIH